MVELGYQWSMQTEKQNTGMVLRKKYSPRQLLNNMHWLFVKYANDFISFDYWADQSVSKKSK